MGLFVLIIVGAVAGQTWYDWRKNSKETVIPDWAKGIASGGVLAAVLAALTSFASGWMQDGTQGASSPHYSGFWPQLGLVAVAGTVICLMTRKRRLPWLILLAGMVLVAFWIGAALGS